MPRVPAPFPLTWFAAFSMIVGCSSSSPPVGGGPTEKAAAREVRAVPATSLPALADPSPTSDPALEAAGPQGWKRLPRKDDQYAIGWYGGSQPNVLPRIFVRVDDWTGEAGDTTPENVAELADEIDRTYASAREQVIEPPQPMLFGGEPWVRYVEEARLGNARAEKQILQRVVGGRRYTVELQIYVGKILEARDQAYAVAAGMKFHPVEETTNPDLPLPAAVPPSADATTPLEDQPADPAHGA